MGFRVQGLGFKKILDPIIPMVRPRTSSPSSLNTGSQRHKFPQKTKNRKGQGGGGGGGGGAGGGCQGGQGGPM